MRSRKVILGTVSLLILLSADALAQQARAVRGTVTDKHGQILAGAIVQLRDNATLQIRSFITQSDATYHFEQLSPDITYRVQAVYKGNYGRSRVVSRFSSRPLVTLDLVIDLSLKRSSNQPSDLSRTALLQRSGFVISALACRACKVASNRATCSDLWPILPVFSRGKNLGGPQRVFIASRLSCYAIRRSVRGRLFLETASERWRPARLHRLTLPNSPMNSSLLAPAWALGQS